MDKHFKYQRSSLNIIILTVRSNVFTIMFIYKKVHLCAVLLYSYIGWIYVYFLYRGKWMFQEECINGYSFTIWIKLVKSGLWITIKKYMYIHLCFIATKNFPYNSPVEDIDNSTWSYSLVIIYQDRQKIYI